MAALFFVVKLLEAVLVGTGMLFALLLVSSGSLLGSCCSLHPMEVNTRNLQQQQQRGLQDAMVGVGAPIDKKSNFVIESFR